MTYLFAFIFGCLSAFAMQPYNLFPFLILGIAGFWILLSAAHKKREGFGIGFLFGFGYMLSGTWWISNALRVGGNPYEWAIPLAMIGLPILLALFYMIAGGIFVALNQKDRSLKSFLYFVIIMSAMEWIRGHALTGFPWNLYGMAWIDHLKIVQIANVFGVYGLSLITIMISAWCGFLLKGHLNKPDKIRFSVLFSVIILSIFTYGHFRLIQNPTIYNQDIVVRIISPNIPQDEKWDPVLYSHNFVKTIDAMSMNFESAQNLEAKTRILLLPETAFGSQFLNDENAKQALQETIKQYKSKTYLFAGALRRDAQENTDKYDYFNSLIALDETLSVRAIFDKFHLVPFGEYMPLQKYIPLAPIAAFEGLTKGTGLQTWQIDAIPPVSPLVCYEIIFPSAVTQKNSTRAKWIANATNDAWYGISPGPYQHLAQAQMRAIEEGLPVARAANTGISAMIDSYGRILKQSALLETSAIETFLPNTTPQPTLYNLYGDKLFYILILILSAPLLWVRFFKQPYQ